MGYFLSIACIRNRNNKLESRVPCLVQDTGGDSRGNEGDGPSKCEVGEGQFIRSPNILRSIVIGCEAKYEVPKKGFKEEFSVLKSRFLLNKKAHVRAIIYVMYEITDNIDRQNRQDRVDQRRSQEFMIGGVFHHD